MQSRLSGWIFACLAFIPVIGIIPAIVAINIGNEDGVSGQKNMGIWSIILNTVFCLYLLTLE